MLISIIITTTLAVVFIILGIVILSGRGDMLIAGYNTASKEEREKYHIKRLRLIIGMLLILVALATPLLMIEDSLWAPLAFAPTVVLLTIVALILANTWAKK